jgi:hypothetical protein
MGMEVEPSTALGKEMAVHLRLFEMNSLKEGAMQHVQLLLCNDHETGE